MVRFSKNVVKKVWGWYLHNGVWYDGDFKIDQLNYSRDQNTWIKHKVFSWEGYGKTLEAMESRFGIWHCGTYPDKFKIIRDLIEHTHKEALEFVEEEMNVK